MSDTTAPNLAPGTLVTKYIGPRRIHTLDDALEHFEVDLNVWKVKSYDINSWEVSAKDKESGGFVTTTNHQVKVKLEPRLHSFNWEIATKDIKKWVEQSRRSVRRNAPDHDPKSVGVIAFSDPHFGAWNDPKVHDTIVSPEYNINKAVRYMEQMVQWINRRKFGEVHLWGLGDFVEGISGLNHLDQWQGMEPGVWYNKPLEVARRILEDMFSRINNLKEVLMVAGNHDRLTPDKAMDTRGSGAAILAKFLEVAGFPVSYHPFLLSRVIDGVGYVAHHGDKGIAKRELADTLWKYGQQGLYNVVMQGHLHTRQTKKKSQSQPIDAILDDTHSYRGVTVPSIFTGNWYSETLGFTSSAGFSCFEAVNGGRNVTHTDVGL
jgi:predicted phosphodiesterase